MNYYNDLIIPVLMFLIALLFMKRMIASFKEDKRACEATIKWCDSSKAIREYKGSTSDPEFHELLLKDAETFVEFLETHPYCLEKQRKYLESLLPKLQLGSQYFYDRARYLLDPSYIES